MNKIEKVKQAIRNAHSFTEGLDSGGQNNSITIQAIIDETLGIDNNMDEQQTRETIGRMVEMGYLTVDKQPSDILFIQQRFYEEE